MDCRTVTFATLYAGRDGRTALDWAVRKDRFNIVKIILGSRNLMPTLLIIEAGQHLLGRCFEKQELFYKYVESAE